MATPLIARPQTANADLQAARINPKSNSVSPAAEDQSASKQEFDQALQGAVEQAKPSATSGAAGGVTDQKATVAADPAQALAQLRQQVEQANQEKNKKQISPEAATLAQTQIAANPNLPVVAANPALNAAAPAAAGEAKAGSAKAPAAPANQAKATQSAMNPAQLQQNSAAAKFSSQMTQAAQAQDAMTASPDLSSINGGSEIQLPDGLGLQDFKFEAGMTGEPGKAATSAQQTSQAAVKPTAVSSNLSTDDYLNLRNFGAGTAKKPASKLTLNTSELGTPGSALSTSMLNRDHGAAQPLATLNAPVTTGHMQKTILSHDAIHQMTNQLSTMNQAKQDGEIKIRLKPDHLGELNLSVRNHGQQISIRIQAQDADSRQIIESSLNSLRDSLSQHNLTVTRMEVTQAPTAPQAAAQDGTQMQMDLGQFRQQQSDTAFQQQQHQESLANRNYWREEESGARPATGIPGTSRARSNVRSAEGLDLIA